VHTFGELVRGHRRRLGLSQEELAERAGLSVRGLRKIENGRTGTPRPVTVRLLADTFALAGAVRDAFVASGTAEPAAPGPADPALIGREQELTALRAAARSAAGGRFQLVWITGEAGMGKSALTRALMSELSAAGWRVALGRSPEVDGAPPTWAWAEIARGLTGDDWEPEAAVVPFRIARAVVDLIIGGDAPLLIVLEDVHRAGPEAFQILRYTAAELADRPVLVAATLRPAEAGHELPSTPAERLSLAGLAEPDVGRLLRERLGETVAPEVVRLVTARTAGNPLFVAETARLIADRGVAAAVAAVPDGVRDVLRRRLAGLDPAAIAVLRAVATFGIEADVELLLSMDPSALDALDTAVSAGLLTEPAPGRVRFSHVLVRDTVYQDLTGVRRSALHAAVLSALTASRPGDVRTLARHALAAAGPSTARPVASQVAAAARLAVQAGAYAEAGALLTGALELLAGSGGALRLDLLCLLVSAQGHCGDVRGARRSRRSAVDLARELGDRSGLARALISYDAPALWANSEFQEPDHDLIAAMTSVLAEPELATAVRCALLAALALEIESIDPERTDRSGREALELANQLDDPPLICRALAVRYRHVTMLTPDRWPELHEIGKRQLDVATDAGLDAYQAQAHHILSIAGMARNDLDAAQWHLDRAAEHATSGQLDLVLAIIAMFRGLRELVAGHFEAAEQAYAPVLAQLRHVGSPNVDEMRLLVHFCLAHARPGPGRESRLAALAAPARAAYERYGDAVAEPYTRLLIAAGRKAEIRTVWRPQVPIPHDHYWFRWTALRAENALLLNDLPTAAECYRQLLPWSGHLPGLLHAHVTLGPVDQTLGDLATALGDPEAAATHYADALAVSDHVGGPHWASRARAALEG
jgi:transcriptional regulator with XRE-family HTH domain/tetratricopeptide (TPR) repeat protein